MFILLLHKVKLHLTSRLWGLCTVGGLSKLGVSRCSCSAMRSECFIWSSGSWTSVLFLQGHLCSWTPVWQWWSVVLSSLSFFFHSNFFFNFSFWSKANAQTSKQHPWFRVFLARFALLKTLFLNALNIISWHIKKERKKNWRSFLWMKYKNAHAKYLHYIQCRGNIFSLVY